MNLPPLTQVPVMKLLIECGAEIDHVTALKRTALVEASWHANKEAMDVLLDAGAKETHGQDLLLLHPINHEEHGMKMPLEITPHKISCETSLPAHSEPHCNMRIHRSCILLL